MFKQLSKEEVIFKLQTEIKLLEKKLISCPENKINETALLLREKMEELEKFKLMQNDN